jgi:hypothetical protein
MQKSLEGYHRILLLVELLLLEAGIELEVVHEVLVVNGEHAHGCVEVFFSGVET